MRYAFIREHSGHWPVRWLCALLDVHRSGFYAWQRKPRHKAGSVHRVTANVLERQFNPSAPNEGWVTDITHIRTQEGWLYLTVVLDLF